VRACFFEGLSTPVRISTADHPINDRRSQKGLPRQKSNSKREKRDTSRLSQNRTFDSNRRQLKDSSTAIRLVFFAAWALQSASVLRFFGVFAVGRHGVVRTSYLER
jgi:hypothetical protein